MTNTDLTELVEINPQRLDGVKTPANGIPFLIMKSLPAKPTESAVTGRAEELGVNNPVNESASKETDVTPAIPPVPANTPDAPVEKSTGDMVAEAVSKAFSPIQEAIKGLESELAALKAMPNTAGAPVITAAKATASMDKSNAAEAARFERLSKSVSDRELARYYAERAKEAREASK